MITVITKISNDKGFNLLKKNLTNLEPDWKIGLNLLCVISDKNLYLKCRDYLQCNIERGECLVVFNEKDGLKAAKDYLNNSNDLVFLLNEGVELSYGGLGKLYETFMEKPWAGFITGLFKEYPQVYWVKDLYGSPQFIYYDKNKSFDLIMGIDISPVFGILTKKSLYKELFCLSDLENYGGYSYGIRLRRQGYQNYINTGVILRGGL